MPYAYNIRRKFKKNEEPTAIYSCLSDYDDDD